MAADGTQSPRTGQARRNWRLVAPPTRAADPRRRRDAFAVRGQPPAM